MRYRHSNVAVGEVVAEAVLGLQAADPAVDPHSRFAPDMTMPLRGYWDSDEWGPRGTGSRE